MMPRGTTGKTYIKDSTLKSIALKTRHVMPALLLQKPSKNSKAKDHLASLERRLKLWEVENISNLLHEGETIQERIKISKKGMTIGKIYLKFQKYDKQRYLARSA